jgi:hypothetical protein
MALELQHSLEESLCVKLPIELLMGMPSLNEFVTRILELLAKTMFPPAQEGARPTMDAERESTETSPPIVEA